MRQGSINATDNKEFILSNRWKCEKSPSGAHHWIIIAYEMACKYCNNKKSANPNPSIDLNPKSSERFEI
jgi:hypothetical protein